MTRIVCIVCDVAKQSSEDRGYCDGCGKRTGNRSIAPDDAPIAPGSALRFWEQRELFEQEAKAVVMFLFALVLWGVFAACVWRGRRG